MTSKSSMVDLESYLSTKTIRNDSTNDLLLIYYSTGTTASWFMHGAKYILRIGTCTHHLAVVQVE